MFTPIFHKILLTLLVVAVVGLSFATASFPWYIAVGALVALVAALLVFRDPFFGILVIAFTLPFERLGAYEFGDTTVRMSQLFLMVTFVGWAAHQVFIRRTRLVKNPIFVPWLVFIIINLISLLNAVNLSRSVIVFSFILFSSVLAFIIPMIVRDKAAVKKVVIAMLISFVLVSAFGLFQFAGDMLGLSPEVTGLRELYTKDVLGFTRVQSTAYEPLYFANYLLLPIAIIFALFLAGRGPATSGMMFLLLGLGMVALVLTVSRGGYLAIAATLLVVGLFYARKLLRPQTFSLIIIATIIVMYVVIQSLGVGGGLFTLDKFQEHVVNAFYGASYNERVFTFEQALTAWQEHPVIGIGPGSFGPWEAPHPAYIPKDGWKIVNNEYVEILAENGVLGLLAFLVFMVMLIVRSIKAIRITSDTYLKAMMVATLGALVGVLAQYLTFSTLYIMHIWFLIGLMIALQNIILLNNENPAVD